MNKMILPHKPGLQKFLEKFNISGHSPESRIISVKIACEGNESYFIAYIYDNFGDYVENIDILVAMNEDQLRRDLTEIHRINYLSKRSFDNFSKWYSKLTNRELQSWELETVRRKFKN